MTLTHGSLFAGIGGFDLGFERAGIKTIWQVEIDPYCRRVLAKHFPDAYRCTDIRDCSGISGGSTYVLEGKWQRRTQYLKPVDVLSGGFPCQDISNAGYKAGIEGERSGLWIEMRRVIGEIRPRIVIVEDVAALLFRGMGTVLGGLAECGYDAEWDCFRASDFGAPHDRERVFIIAYPHGDRLEAHAHETILRHAVRVGAANGHARSMGCKNEWATPRPLGARPMGVGNGVSADVDRLRGLGNAIVPQIAEWIGRRIVEAVGEKVPECAP